MKKGKKIIGIILFILVLLGGIYFYNKSCYSKITIYIDENNSLETFKIRNGNAIKKLDRPNKEGYAFIGWYKLGTENTNELFDLNTIINEDTILVARWATISIE